MTTRRTCGHEMPTEGLVEIFGEEAAGDCQECQRTKALYDAVYTAMGGNVYSLALLAGAGLIPGTRPTLADLNQAGVTLHARMTDEMRQRVAAEAMVALEDVIA